MPQIDDAIGARQQRGGARDRGDGGVGFGELPGIGDDSDDAEEVAGASLQEFWARAIEGTAELDYAEALETLGLRFRAPDANGGRRAWLGVSLRNDAGRLLVSQVRRDTPGAAAGLNVDDEILAIDDVRVRADRIDARLAQYSAGDKVTLLVARREQMLELPLTFGAEPERRWRLELTPTPTDAQRQARQSWAGH